MRVSYASQSSCLETAKRRSDAARPQSTFDLGQCLTQFWHLW